MHAIESYATAMRAGTIGYSSGETTILGLQHFHTGQANTFDVERMNRQMARGLMGYVVTAATAALAPITGATPPGMWLQTYEMPATAVAWDNQLQRLQHHPAMISPQVQSFLKAAPGADAGAIRDLYDLTERFFFDVVDLQHEYSVHHDHDTGEPVLFLTLRTQGQLDLDQLLKREIDLFSAADLQPALKAVQAYHVVTAV